MASSWRASAAKLSLVADANPGFVACAGTRLALAQRLNLACLEFSSSNSFPGWANHGKFNRRLIIERPLPRLRRFFVGEC